MYGSESLYLEMLKIPAGVLVHRVTRLQRQSLRPRKAGHALASCLLAQQGTLFSASRRARAAPPPLSRSPLPLPTSGNGARADWPLFPKCGRPTKWPTFAYRRHPVRQSVISRSHPALTPPPALNPAPPLPFNHKYRVHVLAPGGYSIVASEVSLSQRTGGSLSLWGLSLRRHPQPKIAPQPRSNAFLSLVWYPRHRSNAQRTRSARPRAPLLPLLM